jgi:hypothetical protein
MEGRFFVVSGMSSLQSKCLGVLGRFLPDYLHAMGREDLNAALSLLPGDTLTTLSIMVSRSPGGGITNDLCYALGANHADLDRLSLRAAPQCKMSSSSSSDTTDTLTDEGLLSLIPPLARSGQTSDNGDDGGGGGTGSSRAAPKAYDSWEDYLSEDEKNDVDHSLFSSSLHSMLHLGESCYSLLRLRRLELIDCQFVSAGAVRQFLQRCSGMTHLSVRGSIFLRTPIQLEEENDTNDTHATNNNNKGRGGDSTRDGAKGKGDPSISLSSFYGPERLLLELPDLLPALQVLDLSHCAWVTTSLLEALDEFMPTSNDNRNKTRWRILGRVLYHHGPFLWCTVLVVCIKTGNVQQGDCYAAVTRNVHFETL